jgi:transcription elongation GreA/GreB family factor
MAKDYSVEEGMIEILLLMAAELVKLYGIIENELKVADGGSFTFKQIFDAEDGRFESLVGTLIAAKKKGAISYKSPMGNLLLQGPHDNIPISFHAAKK